jgi:hypothetical protein
MMFVELIFRRAEGLIFSILFFSDFFKYIINYFEYYEIILIVYCFMVLLCLIEDYIFNKLIRDFRINFNMVNSLRYGNTILGRMLNCLIELLLISEYKINVNNIFVAD